MQFPPPLIIPLDKKSRKNVGKSWMNGVCVLFFHNSDVFFLFRSKVQPINATWTIEVVLLMTFNGRICDWHASFPVFLCFGFFFPLNQFTIYAGNSVLGARTIGQKGTPVEKLLNPKKVFVAPRRKSRQNHKHMNNTWRNNYNDSLFCSYLTPLRGYFDVTFVIIIIIEY